MEQITREEMMGLLNVAACPAYCNNGVIVRDQLHGEIEQCQFCYEREHAIIALQAAEPAMVIEVGRGVHGIPAYEELFFNESLENGRHELFALPCPPAKVSHWSFENPGRADQYRAEALAARRALGFREDADDVAPADLEDAINALRQPATELAPESWREELETIAEILEADGDEWNCAARIRKMLTASPAPGHSGDDNEMADALYKLANLILEKGSFRFSDWLWSDVHIPGIRAAAQYLAARSQQEEPER